MVAAVHGRIEEAREYVEAGLAEIAAALAVLETGGAKATAWEHCLRVRNAMRLAAYRLDGAA